MRQISPENEPLVEVSLLLGAHMLMLSDIVKTEAEGKEKLLQALRSGAGLQKLRRMIEALGGDPAYIDAEKIKELCRVRRLVEVYPLQDGYHHTELNIRKYFYAFIFI